MNTACSARDQLKTRTKADSRRVARPMVTVPKLPQSAWACSPGGGAAGDRPPWPARGAGSGPPGAATRPSPDTPVGAPSRRAAWRGAVGTAARSPGGTEGRGRERSAARRRAGQSAPSRGPAAPCRGGDRVGRRSSPPASARRRTGGGSRSPAPGDHAPPPPRLPARRRHRRRARCAILVPPDEAARAATAAAPGGGGGIRRNTCGCGIGRPFWPAARAHRDGRRERGRGRMPHEGGGGEV